VDDVSYKCEFNPAQASEASAAKDKEKKMGNVAVLNNKGEKVESLKLNERLFDGKVNKPLLQQAVKMHLANQRTGSAAAKTREEVRGGGAKPWRQKGTGRARVGSIRSPLWRGGGVTFGPLPKDWHYQLPKKMKKKALIVSLNTKVNENKLVVIDEIKMESHKTKELCGMLKGLKLDNKRLLIVPSRSNENLSRASRNIKNVELSRLEDINAYQVLLSDSVLVEKAALQALEKKLMAVS